MNDAKHTACAHDLYERYFAAESIAEQNPVCRRLSSRAIPMWYLRQQKWPQANERSRTGRGGLCRRQCRRPR